MVMITLIWIVTIVFDNVDTIGDYNNNDIKEISATEQTICMRKNMRYMIFWKQNVTHILYRDMIQHISARGEAIFKHLRRYISAISRANSIHSSFPLTQKQPAICTIL